MEEESGVSHCSSQCQHMMAASPAYGRGLQLGRASWNCELCIIDLNATQPSKRSHQKSKGVEAKRQQNHKVWKCQMARCEPWVPTDVQMTICKEARRRCWRTLCTIRHGWNRRTECALGRQLVAFRRITDGYRNRWQHAQSAQQCWAIVLGLD